MISSNLYKEILAEYETLSDNAKKKLKEKKEICYKKCPRIKEIDEELSMSGIKIAKSVIYADKEEKQNYINSIKNLIQNLKFEKEKLMYENGFSVNYFDDAYICNKCKDTGFINNEYCDCFKQKLINKAYDMSNLSNLLKTENFSNFSLDYYSKQIDKENDMSPYENMKLIMRKCSLFIEEFDEKLKNMVFYGNTGLGKTFLCKHIAKELLDREKTVLYVTSFNLFRMFENEKFSKDIENINKDILNLVKEVDLLIIDDLGTEFITNLSLTEFFEIINSRLLNKKPTLISTNLSPNDIKEYYSNRIVSRLYGEYDMIKFFGDDIRILKRFK